MTTFKFDPKNLALGLAMGVGAMLLVAAQRPVPTSGPAGPLTVPSVPTVAQPAPPRFQMEAYATWNPQVSEMERGVLVLETQTGRVEYTPFERLTVNTTTQVRKAQP